MNIQVNSQDDEMADPNQEEQKDNTINMVYFKVFIDIEYWSWFI